MMPATNFISTLLSAVLCLTALPTLAQTFPNKPIRLIVGASAGGTTDTFAREIAYEMTTTLGQAVIVENKAGAGGILAAQEVARAAPDGYTLLVCFTSHTMNASLFKKLSYDPIADFTPIIMLAKVSSVLVTRADHTAKTLQDFIKLAKTGGSSFAIGGLGSSLQMDTYGFAAATGIAITQVPYKGTSPALTNLIGGHVDAMFAPLGGARPYLQSGQLKAIGVAGSKRIPSFPGVAAITEVVPGFTTNYGWFGLLGPARMNPELIRVLNAAVGKALQSPRLKARLDFDGATPEGGSPQQLANYMQADLRHWASQVKAFGIQPD